MEPSNMRPMMNYPCIVSIWEYFDWNARLYIVELFCPSLRSINDSVPIHIKNLDLLLSDRITIDNHPYDFESFPFKREQVLNWTIKNPKRPIYVEEFFYASFGEVEKIQRKIVPKSLFYVNCDLRTEVLSERNLSFLENDTFIDTRNVKKLKVAVTDRFDALAKHPIIGQLEHLEVLVDPLRFRDISHVRQLSDIPVSHLSINGCTVPTTVSILIDWFLRRERNRKFSVVISENANFVIPILSGFVQLKEGIFESKMCWVYFYEESDSEVVLYLEEDEHSPTSKIISLQILPKGSAELVKRYDVPGWLFSGGSAFTSCRVPLRYNEKKRERPEGRRDAAHLVLYALFFFLFFGTLMLH